MRPYAQYGSPQWVSSGSWWLTRIIGFCILSQQGHAERVWKCVCVCVCVCVCLRAWVCVCMTWRVRCEGRLYLSFLHSSLGIMGPHLLLPLFFHLAHIEWASAGQITSGVVCCRWEESPWSQTRSPALRKADSDAVGGSVCSSHLLRVLTFGTFASHLSHMRCSHISNSTAVLSAPFAAALKMFPGFKGDLLFLFCCFFLHCLYCFK